MIQLSNLIKLFDSVTAVDGIDLSIKPGEIVGLLGPNGAGKTTTMRMMAGVLPPSSGTVAIDDMSFDLYEHTLKQRIGYLPENNPLDTDLTVAEHLQYWGNLKGLNAAALKEGVAFAVENTGIEDVYYRLISTLSKGYRQRVGLAQAILAQPDILLLDEPTEGLDPNQRKDIQSLLSELKSSRTVIVSSHVLSEISQLAGRIVIIHQGKVVGDDTPKHLTQRSTGKPKVIAEIVGKAVLTGLKSLKRIEGVSKLADGTFEITFSGKKDIRPELFDLAVKKKWQLLNATVVEKRLEDVFSELTKGV